MVVRHARTATRRLRYVESCRVRHVAGSARNQFVTAPRPTVGRARLLRYAPACVKGVYRSNRGANATQQTARNDVFVRPRANLLTEFREG